MHSSKDLLSKENREWFQKLFTELVRMTESTLALKGTLKMFILTSDVFSYRRGRSTTEIICI